MEKERRTYQETFFWMFIVCLLITLASEHYSIPIEEMQLYAENILAKTFKNLNSFMIWIIPISIMIKKEITAWRTSKYDKEIEIARLNAQAKGNE